jgi:hypothetical protein
MTSKRLALTIAAAAAVLGACSTPSANPATQGPVATLMVAVATATPAVTPAATSAPAPTEPGAGGSAPPPDVDPCTLLTKDEATTLMGAKVGDGVSTVVDQDRVCTWKGSGLSEVKLFLAPKAPDAQTAQAYWDAAKAAQPADIKTADVPGFDRAAYGNGSSQGVSVSALFVIHGTWFFDLFCGFPACSVGNHVTAANLIVGRLP